MVQRLSAAPRTRLHAALLLGAVLAAGCSPAPAERQSFPGDGKADTDERPTWTPDPAVDPACAAPGCLRAVEHLADATAAEIQALVAPGVRIDNGYAIWRVTFATDDGWEARAIVTLPDGETPDSGFHLAVNNHGTAGVADLCALGNGVGGIGLAGTFGARGLVGVAPDYPGLGTPGLHPYLVRALEGRASLDAARAGRNLAARQDVRTSGRAVFAGLSQGGHATLAAAMEHQRYAPEIDARAFAAVAPASCFLEQWASGAAWPGPHLVYHAMLVYAWASFYGDEPTDYFAPEVKDSIGDLMASRCLVDPYGGPTLKDALPQNPAALFDPAFLAAYTAGALADYPIMDQGFAENRIRGWTQTAPLRIYQGTADDTVIRPHTDELVSALRADGIDLSYVVVDGGGHTDIAFSFLADPQLRTEEALAWLKEGLE